MVPVAPPFDGPYKCVVITCEEVDSNWRQQLSKWLVGSGCLYMMAHGPDCSLWDESVDFENLEGFDHGDVPDKAFVWTTFHQGETLEEVLWFAKYTAFHDVVDLDHLLILDLCGTDRQDELLTKNASFD